MLLDPLQSREVFTDALRHHYAILAVNADSPAAITDCLEAARLERAPIIIETSLWQLIGHSFGYGNAIMGMSRYIAQLALLAAEERYRSIPVIFHTDHIKGPDTSLILKAAIAGIPSMIGGKEIALSASTVSLDSSELTEDQNIKLICELCEAARSAKRPATLEVEAGVDNGVTPLSVAERILTSIEKRHAGYVWLWAPGLGNRHGFSDAGFPEFRPSAAAEHAALARKLLGREVGIALHGSSGLAEQSLREAVSAGVVKVNWSSESLLLRSSAARDFYAANAEQLEKSHPKFKATAMDNGLQSHISAAYIPAVRERIALLRSSGRAPELAGHL